MHLVQRGLATIYTGGGAVYDDNLALLQKKQAAAERRGKGVWSLGKHKMVTPAEFKQRLKLQRQLQPATI